MFFDRIFRHVLVLLGSSSSLPFRQWPKGVLVHHGKNWRIHVSTIQKCQHAFVAFTVTSSSPHVTNYGEVVVPTVWAATTCLVFHCPVSYFSILTCIPPPPICREYRWFEMEKSEKISKSGKATCEHGLIDESRSSIRSSPKSRWPC